MQMIEFWIWRKGERPPEVPREVSDAISANPHNECFFCDDGYELGAVIAFRGREPKTPIATLGVCIRCCALWNDDKLAEFTQRKVLKDGVVRLPPNFTPDCNDPDSLLEAAARLTLRLALRCDWVEGCEDKADDDPDSWNGLYERIQDLTAAYVHSREGEGEKPNYLMSRIAGSVASQIAK